VIPQTFDRQQVQQYVETLRAHLGDEKLKDVSAAAAAQVAGDGEPAQKLSRVLPALDSNYVPSSGGRADGVPFLARDPMISLFQSSLENKLRDHGVEDQTPQHCLWSEIVHTAKRVLHPLHFGPADPEWVTEVGEAMLARLADGNHPFNPQAAKHEINDNARLVVVGDWGTGLPRARAVAELMAGEVEEARKQGRDVHVVHLGDVYYSGLPEEVTRNVLPFWPVTAAHANEGVSSWSLNGNHDMYGGGFGYFDTLLADDRFKLQRSPNGKATSFFRLTSPSWDFVALDTSWDPNVLAFGKTAVLQDPQAEFLATTAAGSPRKLMLLSHHQLVSVYAPEDIDIVLPTKLAGTLGSGRVTGWIWGHEHRCMGFDADKGVKFPRCLGNGGVPVLMTHALDEAIPAPGAWEARGFLDDQGEHWARFGYATLDLEGDRIRVRYRDDQGAPAAGTPADGETIE
jgi:hypothetical protein